MPTLIEKTAALVASGKITAQEAHNRFPGITANGWKELAGRIRNGKLAPPENEEMEEEG